MKIQLSKKRVIPDAMTAWHEPGPDVDIVVDLKKLPFAPGSIEKLYAFHVLEHFFPSEIVPALASWKECMVHGGKMFLVNDDFEFVARSLLGGDISIEQFNEGFTHPTYFTRDNIVTYLNNIGVSDDKIVLWFADVADEFPKAEHELVVMTNL